ncbi:MAG: threonine/serine dehydratase [Candidatus Dormibacteria bacterium]
MAPYLRPTALFRYGGLDRLLGTRVWVKHENHQPVGAFKVRGGINLLAHMPAEERARGVVTASTGNHGQSIAYASRLFDVTATVYAPANANPLKVEAMRDMGASVVLEGRTFDDAKAAAERASVETGARYVHSGNEPLLIGGVATLALEIFEDEPHIDIVLVPVGAGTGAAGVGVVKSAVKPGATLIGVQSAQAPAAYRSWQSHELVTAPNETVAEGLATGQPFELPQRIMRDTLDDFVTVEDDELLDATARMITLTRNLVEPAGASALAAALRLRERLAGRNVALVCSGGNIGPAQLRSVVDRLASS